MNTYKCDCCNHLFKENEIESVNDTTGASDGVVDICPKCNVPEMFSVIPDLDWNFENREEARLDAMYDARYANEPTEAEE